MKENKDVFNKFRDSFNKLDGHFHILEQRVPIERQMEYFKYSEKIRRKIKNSEKEILDYDVLEERLINPESSIDDKMYVLSLLGTSRQVKAYRMLEAYAEAPDSKVADWAYMALMESRIALESEFSDEKQIYISTGLGGKGEKLRFNVLLVANELKPFLPYQKRVIEREFAYFLQQADCEIERLSIEETYVELLFLISFKANIKSTLEQIILECNQYGNFLSDRFTITNVKELTTSEIEEILINHERNSKSSN